MPCSSVSGFPRQKSSFGRAVEGRALLKIKEKIGIKEEAKQLNKKLQKLYKRNTTFSPHNTILFLLGSHPRGGKGPSPGLW